MKTNDILLVGAGATIVYLLWKRSKKAKDVKSLTGGSGATTGAISMGASAGAISTKPEQIYPLELPPNMDLPNLTGGTGTPTEVAVQQGGVITSPTPAIVTAPVLSANDSLNSIINVIPKDDVLPPKGFPVLSPCEQKWVEYSAMIKYASQQAYEIAKADFINKCEGKTIEPILPVKPVKFPNFEVAQDVLPVSSEEYQNNIIKNKGDLYNAPATLSANGVNSNGRVINARLYRGVM
jgi:hypothetical protein